MNGQPSEQFPINPRRIPAADSPVPEREMARIMRLPVFKPRHDYEGSEGRQERANARHGPRVAKRMEGGSLGVLNDEVNT